MNATRDSLLATEEATEEVFSTLVARLTTSRLPSPYYHDPLLKRDSRVAFTSVFFLFLSSPFVSDFPRTVTMKVQKHELKEIAKRILPSLTSKSSSRRPATPREAGVRSFLEEKMSISFAIREEMESASSGSA